LPFFLQLLWYCHISWPWQIDKSWSCPLENYCECLIAKISTDSFELCSWWDNRSSFCPWCKYHKYFALQSGSIQEGASKYEVHRNLTPLDITPKHSFLPPTFSIWWKIKRRNYFDWKSARNVEEIFIYFIFKFFWQKFIDLLIAAIFYKEANNLFLALLKHYYSGCWVNKKCERGSKLRTNWNYQCILWGNILLLSCTQKIYEGAIEWWMCTVEE